MVFKCQEDSFLKQFTTKVVSVEKCEKGFNVILEDTILFPEGGGQSTDWGYLNKIHVKNVSRRGGEALHFVEADDVPFKVGDEVNQILDWPRRWDHMCQHSGQHLITAIFDKELGYSTKSWWLGSEDSYIELNAKDVTKEEMEKIEKIVNQMIVDCVPISVRVYESNDLALKSDKVRTRGLPEDVTGPIRVVTIEGLEKNMCCGTHVNNLAQLQMIKFLYLEKAKGKILLHFLVGGRILRKLTDSYDRELEMNLLLKGGAENHLDLIKKMQMNLKNTQKYAKKMMTEIALFEAEKFNNMEPKPKSFSIHRTDGVDLDFINTFLRNVKAPDTLLFLTAGDDTGKGQMVLYGHPDVVSTIGNELCTLLDGKGNSKAQRFNAKINKLKNIPLCEKFITEFYQ